MRKAVLCTLIVLVLTVSSFVGCERSYEYTSRVGIGNGDPVKTRMSAEGWTYVDRSPTVCPGWTPNNTPCYSFQFKRPAQ